MNFKSYIELLKLRLSSSVVFSAIAGYLLAISEKTPHDPIILFKLILGGFFIVGSSNGLNQVFEIDVDGLMERTKNRPLPKKKLSLNSAILFSLFLGIIGLLILFSINLYSGFFSLASLLIYVLGYTPMKVSTPIAGFIGAIPGAMPFMLGWVALQGNFGIEPGVFFCNTICMAIPALLVNCLD